MRVKIRAPTRLHFALCDLGRASPFAIGGVGLGITNPRIEIWCQPGSGAVELLNTSVSWKREIAQLISDLNSHVDTSSVDLTVSSSVPAHCGFGSHTVLALGLIEAVGLTLDKGWTRDFIVAQSGRGGTSGVGIQTYFCGGLAYDFGRSSRPEHFLPSSAIVPASRSVLGPPIAWPSNWIILLALVKGKRVYGKEERKFFRENTPVTKEEAMETIVSIHHGLLPAIISQDLRILSESLRDLHQVGFKATELRNQSSKVRQLYSTVAANHIACGMSSFGPLVYAIVDRSDRSSINLFNRVSEELGVVAQVKTAASTGREVSCIG